MYQDKVLPFWDRQTIKWTQAEKKDRQTPRQTDIKLKHQNLRAQKHWKKPSNKTNNKQIKQTHKITITKTNECVQQTKNVTVE